MQSSLFHLIYRIHYHHYHHYRYQMAQRSGNRKMDRTFCTAQSPPRKKPLCSRPNITIPEQCHSSSEIETLQPYVSLRTKNVRTKLLSTVLYREDLVVGQQSAPWLPHPQAFSRIIRR